MRRAWLAAARPLSCKRPCSTTRSLCNNTTSGKRGVMPTRVLRGRGEAKLKAVTYCSLQGVMGVRAHAAARSSGRLDAHRERVDAAWLSPAAISPAVAPDAAAALRRRGLRLPAGAAAGAAAIAVAAAAGAAAAVWQHQLRLGLVHLAVEDLLPHLVVQLQAGRQGGQACA